MKKNTLFDNYINDSLTDSEYEELMESMLHKVAKKFYGNEYAYHIDKNQRKIPDHLHWHARKS